MAGYDQAGEAYSRIGRIGALSVKRRVSLDSPQEDPDNVFRTPTLGRALSADLLQRAAKHKVRSKMISTIFCVFVKR